MGINNYIINGTTPFSAMIRKIVESEGHKVLCFTTLRKFMDMEKLDDLPIIATEDLTEHYNTEECFVINTVGYTKMNTIREKAQSELDLFDLQTVSYISSRAIVYTNNIGNGCIIMPGAFVGPDVELGIGNIVYSNAVLTHHIKIGNYNFIASGCVLGGGINIANNCFIGLNSTIRNRISIPSFTLIGCASNIIKPIAEENSVFYWESCEKDRGFICKRCSY